MGALLAVDIGGTFSDLVIYDDSSRTIEVAKGATTPHAPEEGLAAVIAEATPAATIESAEFFLHGSTIALNALLERKGATIGLLTTFGFRDVLEIRRGNRDIPLDMFWQPLPPLVPRRLRYGVRERVLVGGAIETPLDEDAIAEAFELFGREQVSSIAVCFINAYMKPDHELQAEQKLRTLGMQGEISLSHRVSGEYGEYERTSTTVIDAYIRPRVSAYLQQLESRLSGLGFGGSCLITRSGGGAMPFTEAAARPFETIMSGPVSGVVGAAHLCSELGIERAVTVDVGGTSSDVCLIVEGRPASKYVGRVLGMPLQTPWVDVRSIGAGGGSLAYIDEGGLLRVGPQSAGADPGPACYGRGGTQPTVTDAAASLGMLASGELAGGVVLDFELARQVLRPIANELTLDLDEAARGILTICAAGMADAIREVTLAQGEDVRAASLVAFGGAGPLFSTLLARELEIPRIVVPNFAGNFSAWGLLMQDIVRSAARSTLQPVDEDGLARVDETLGLLFEELEQRGAVAEIRDARVQREAALDMRYAGQEYTLTVPLNTGAGHSPSAVSEGFERQYKQTFGQTLAAPVEVVSVRATLRTHLPRPGIRSDASTMIRDSAQTLQAYSFTEEQRTDFSVLERGTLARGSRTAGPAIILEPTATTYLDAGFTAEVDESGCLILTGGSE